MKPQRKRSTIESFEALILMSASGTDVEPENFTDLTGNFGDELASQSASGSSGIGGTASLDGGETSSRELTEGSSGTNQGNALTGPLFNPDGSYAADGSFGEFGFASGGQAVPGSGTEGVSGTSSQPGGGTGITTGTSSGASTADLPIGPTSPFGEANADGGFLSVPGDGNQEGLNVRGDSRSSNPETEFFILSPIDETLPELFIRQIHIVGHEIWVLSEVEETPFTAPSESTGLTVSSVRVVVPQDLHTAGYNVREFRIGGAPDGTLSEAITEVTDVDGFLDFIDGEPMEVLYDLDVDGVRFPQGDGTTSAFQVGDARAENGQSFRLLLTDDSSDFEWLGTLPGNGPAFEEIQPSALNGSGSEHFSILLEPTALDSSVQPVVFNSSAFVSDFDQLHIEDIRIVGNEVRLLTVLERGDRPGQVSGHISHRVEVEIPQDLHEQGYEVREYRLGGTLDDSLRDGVQSIDSKDEYLSTLEGVTSQVLYDHNDPDLFIAPQGQIYGVSDPELVVEVPESDVDWTVSPSLHVSSGFDGTGTEPGPISNSVGEGGFSIGHAGDTTDGEVASSGDDTDNTGGGNATGGAPVADDGQQDNDASNQTSAGVTDVAEVVSDENNSASTQDDIAAATGDNLAASTESSPNMAGTSSNDWLEATGDDSLLGLDGDDEFIAAIGTNELNGGSGLDTLYVYEGTSADFVIDTTDTGFVITGAGLNGGSVHNTLVDIERIVFNDREIDLTSIVGNAPSNADGIPPTPPFIGGTIGNDDLTGTSGDDEFFATAGDNIIDGGDGYDTLFVYGGNYRVVGAGSSTGGTGAIQEGFDAQRISDKTVVVQETTIDGIERNYELTNVERIVFDNEVVYLDGPGYKTLHGTDAGEWLTVDECTDFVQAGAGDDFIHAASNSVRRINGGDGTDTLVLYGLNQADVDLVDLRESFGAYWILSPTFSVDFVNVEFIQFDDGRLATTDILPPQGDNGYGRAAVVLPPFCVHV